MAVTNLSRPTSTPPNEGGFVYAASFEDGDAVLVRPNLRLSLGRVSIGWSLNTGVGAAIVRDVSMVWPDPRWTVPPEPDEPYRTSWVDYEDAPFSSMRFRQTGGALSVLTIVSRWPLTLEEG